MSRSVEDTMLEGVCMSVVGSVSSAVVIGGSSVWSRISLTVVCVDIVVVDRSVVETGSTSDVVGSVSVRSEENK